MKYVYSTRYGVCNKKCLEARSRHFIWNMMFFNSIALKQLNAAQPFLVFFAKYGNWFHFAIDGANQAHYP